MKVVIRHTVQKYIDKLDRATIARIDKAIEGLQKNPPAGDIKKLVGEVKKYRLRVGNYRILFAIVDDVIVLDKIAPRGEVYKE